MKFMLWVIVTGVFMMSTPTWGAKTDAPPIPTVRERLFNIDYTETELRYDPDLPKRAARPKTQQQVIELYHKALTDNQEDDNYLIHSFFSVGCSDLNRLYYAETAKEECAIANFFLKRVLKINPNNGLALLTKGFYYQHSFEGVEENMQKAISYYEKAYHLYGNRVLAAGSNLYGIYMHGFGGIPQDLKKAKYYLAKVAEDNPRGQDAYYLKNFDTFVDLLKISDEGDKCKQQDPNNREWIIKCSNEVERKTQEYLKKYRGTQKEIDANG
ncbi:MULTISPECIES: sel1 repeat family protein [Providencia]|uniref:sel1 repeat family protein n=2 Tax=Providencia TaxID=586 RepID=UPI0015EB5F2D|nr:MULTISPECIES: sel1 repeat family protein [Providencia]ELR5137811.1 sel1 repeat family protein [Providencia rettgeri]QLQ95157.1 sel1 repeat family protein [Providencia rettgeri]HCH7937175.1 sel1 repeat family protein [Providencia rettgeri]